jgi:hypothetical protein
MLLSVPAAAEGVNAKGAKVLEMFAEREVSVR